MNKLYMSVAEAARSTKMSRYSLERSIDSGELHARRDGRHYQIAPRDLDAFVAAQQSEENTDHADSRQADLIDLAPPQLDLNTLEERPLAPPADSLPRRPYQIEAANDGITVHLPLPPDALAAARLILQLEQFAREAV